jgi:hypothetical protein
LKLDDEAQIQEGLSLNKGIVSYASPECGISPPQITSELPNTSHVFGNIAADQLSE